MEKLLKEVRLLKIYSMVLTCVLVFIALLSFRRDTGKQKFQEIDVERINVVEKDGTLKMVISNAERQHPGLVDGKELAKRDRPAGMIFFNSVGDECGGLVYDGDKKESGMTYSVDQFHSDQIMQLDYSEERGPGDKQRSYGMRLWDRRDDFPISRTLKVVDSLTALKDKAVFDQQVASMEKEGKFGTERLFMGKTKKGEMGLFIRDEKGTVRIKIYVDKDGRNHVQTFDESGQPEQR